MQYSCHDCLNLKTRLLKTSDIKPLVKNMRRRILPLHEIARINLTIPLNNAAYKRLARKGSCPVIYCSKNSAKRDAYIYKDNFDKNIASITPCPGYR
jgi:hypothetical protein